VCAGSPNPPPGEITGLKYLSDKVTLLWDPGTGLYDVPRGTVTELPVGTGASEICLATGLTTNTTTDSETPGAGVSFWYLVRAVNACGEGIYGHASSGGTEVTSACP
jgi:hypothetical protein